MPTDPALSPTAVALRQTRPFASPEHEVFVALQLLALRLQREAGDLFRTEDLTLPQFNVLRILRGSGNAGLTCGEVGERLIAQVPDVTRLLDRLEARGLASRLRSETDRRVVRTHLTAGGAAVLDRLEAPLAALHRGQFARLGPEKLAALLALVEELSAPDPTLS